MIGWSFCWRKRQGGHSNIINVPWDGRDKDIGHWTLFSFRHAWDVRSGIGCQFLPELGDAVGLVCLAAGVLVEVFPAQAHCRELERV
jgi:hypothetical protein